jgi:hypothetical protein
MPVYIFAFELHLTHNANFHEILPLRQAKLLLILISPLL